MSLLLPVILLVVFFACIGFLFTEGMWSNAIRLVNVIVAALLAMNFFEPLARYLTDWNETLHTYVAIWDFLSLWLLFSLFMMIFRAITDRISRVKVRFLSVVDRVGSGIFAAIIGWVMMSFTLATFHAAPLSLNFMGGAFRPGEKMFLGMMSPDLQWLGFTKAMSAGAFSRSDPEVFGERVEYVSQQAEKRRNLEVYNPKWLGIRINPNALRQGAIPTSQIPKPPED